MNVPLRQSDLFPAVLCSARISDDELYRLELRRVWDDALPLLVVCMLNPSKADAKVNDPTILVLMWFAKLWGYGGIVVVNLFAFRSSSPAAMMKADNPFGPGNADALRAAIAYARDNGGRLVAAWGTGGDLEDRAEWFCARARMQGVSLICLGTTKGGHPKHPMARGRHRIPREQQPIVWREAKS